MTPATQYKPVESNKRMGKQYTREMENNRLQKGSEHLRPIKNNWPCSWNPSVPHHQIQGLQNRSTDTESGIKVLRDCEVPQRRGARDTDFACSPRVQIKLRVQPSLTHTVKVEHHKDGAYGYTQSYTACIILPHADQQWAMSRSSTPQVKKRDHGYTVQ